jgi:hypothetical protein
MISRRQAILVQRVCNSCSAMGGVLGVKGLLDRRFDNTALWAMLRSFSFKRRPSHWLCDFFTFLMSLCVSVC